MLNKNNRFTVLIIDDTPINILVLKKTLQNNGYQIFSATNGKEGRAKAKEEKPNLILLDIMMPEEDGFETIKKIKEDNTLSNIPILFLSAMTDIDSKIKGFDLGAVDFISKPFHPKEVLARVALHIKMNIATQALLQHQKNKLSQITNAQQAMLVKPSDFPAANFAVYYNALLEAGGDFYDVIDISENITGYFIADVSGHDIATSFITASVKALLQQNCSAIYTPVESMNMINSILTDILPTGKYLTACYVTINRKTMKMTIVNMGHPPLVHKQKDQKAKLIKQEGDILGAFTDVIFSVHEQNIKKDDNIYLYTDGLIESGDKSEVWSKNLNKLILYVNEINDVEIEDCVNKLQQKALTENSVIDDDIVVLGIKI